LRQDEGRTGDAGGNGRGGLLGDRFCAGVCARHAAGAVGRLLPATMLELPVILTASWFAAGWLVRRFAIASSREALAVGAFAFATLMVAECALASVLTGQSPAQWLAGLRQPHALLGLAGQVMFALMPWWRARKSASRPARLPQ
jgi:hypothetical protein